ncbi:GNAT family N-acetyltransferase [Erwinia sp. OLTSP20]|uniref:GNAT family N-acetyltransferase n=1 Tax=unclassified Erwinia TaxID=2622719 RepID=UPI000C180F7C|nr:MULTISPECIES: N-acetyltransferase [unclassified Erwinia]PIJ51012.1 GNAT family N-acetyltransferase [Erwinia sp. OAMSP11]PIJ73720.1 GNAT family N-acetyltransferase [Erwinia sp. OLSSP12]PIJ83077.1 GNAT family N-acetyltransferase [Erwinia sp. OLCASP19]PIJ85675.1 GNAT family N-acetyltransferase [Erwinia sp. OLMTSP26]PIJ87674.1 GNAT family N-acetyltransferase [Erwinia sp. OLMDSP33]
MLIRTEIGVDAASIDSLLRSCFAGSDEAQLVHQLREDGLLTLGMVATDEEGQVLGYAAFSPLTLRGEDRGWVVLSPLAVDERMRGEGLGKKLIYEAMDVLNEFGYSAIFVLGDATRYGRYGFVPAADYQLRCRWPESEATFQVYPLAAQAVEGVQGEVEFSAPFNRV